MNLFIGLTKKIRRGGTDLRKRHELSPVALIDLLGEVYALKGGTTSNI